MKLSTEEKLYKEIDSGEYDFTLPLNKMKSLSFLLDIYLSEEFDDVDSFFDYFIRYDTRDLEFYTYLMENIDKFNITPKVLQASGRDSAKDLLSMDIMCELRKITRNCDKFTLRDRKRFTNIVENIFNGKNLLDIGSGRDLPVSSLFFARDLGKVSSMDEFRWYWKTTNFFKKMNIDIKDEFFFENTDISPYNTLVGQAPCTAIIPVVKRCANSEGKEYFIELCDCCSPRNGMEGLVDYLKEKDKNLKCLVIKRDRSSNKEYCVRKDEMLGEGDIVYATNSSMPENDLLEIVREGDR